MALQEVFSLSIMVILLYIHKLLYINKRFLFEQAGRVAKSPKDTNNHPKTFQLRVLNRAIRPIESTKIAINKYYRKLTLMAHHTKSTEIDPL